jgi:hypothetical protein
VTGRVYLGNDGDEAVLGVGYEPAKVFGAVERDVGLRVLGRRSDASKLPA